MGAAVCIARPGRPFQLVGLMLRGNRVCLCPVTADAAASLQNQNQSQDDFRRKTDGVRRDP
jgi:hypothetical protein